MKKKKKTIRASPVAACTQTTSINFQIFHNHNYLHSNFNYNIKKQKECII